MCSFSWFSVPVLTASLLVPSSPKDRLCSLFIEIHCCCIIARQLSGGRTHPLVQSCSPEVLCVSWTRFERGDCSCSCQWCSSWCRPTSRSPSGSPCSNSPSCSADGRGPAEKQQAAISIIAWPMPIFRRVRSLGEKADISVADISFWRNTGPWCWFRLVERDGSGHLVGLELFYVMLFVVRFDGVCDGAVGLVGLLVDGGKVEQRTRYLSLVMLVMWL